MSSPVLLASTSKFRQQLLASCGLQFTSAAPQVDEKKIVGINAQQTAIWRARAKSLDLTEKFPHHIIIGADQTVGWQDQTIDKVESSTEAFKRLRQLAGTIHHLHSAVVLSRWHHELKQGEVVDEIIVDVPMQMRPLTDAEIESYVRTNEWQGCAGCYQIENQGINLFEHIGGDSSSIIGLPLIPLLKSLRALGIDLLR